MAALVRAKTLELCPSVPLRRSGLKGFAKHLLAVASIKTTFTLPKDKGVSEL